jgi:hypothetical protein
MQDACDFMQEPKMLGSEPEHSNAPARRTLLAKIIREQSVGRQTELVELLRKLGHVATQSSVSRDLRELGVAKMGDRYVLPETAMQPRPSPSIRPNGRKSSAPFPAMTPYSSPPPAPTHSANLSFACSHSSDDKYHDTHP